MDCKYWYNAIPMLQKFSESEYESDEELAFAIIDGINRHPDLQNQEAYDEINACLEDTWVSSEVNKARWSAYYLNLQNIIDICWEAGSLVGCGRGSGVGFILLYCLDITQINPLREHTRTFRWRLTQRV
jgi:DNA polymerase III alpha subunit